MVTFLTPLVKSLLVALQLTRGSIGPAFAARNHTENLGQANICPFALREVSVLTELALGHLRYHFADVPPQSNSPPDSVPSKAQSPRQSKLLNLDTTALINIMKIASCIHNKSTQTHTHALNENMINNQRVREGAKTKLEVDQWEWSYTDKSQKWMAVPVSHVQDTTNRVSHSNYNNYPSSANTSQHNNDTLTLYHRQI